VKPAAFSLAAAVGLEHAERLAQDGVLVVRQVDDAVGDDDVDRIVWQRDALDRALQEFDVGRAGLALILARQRQHFVGHVEAVGFAGRADALCGQQHVDAAARSEVEHDLARLEREQGGGVAAAERGGDGISRQAAGFQIGIEVGRGRLDRGGDGAVFVANSLLNV
jgi:hypothetical protein